MKYKIASLILAISIVCGLPGLTEAGKNWTSLRLSPQNISQRPENTKIQFFVNGGFYQPGLKQFNDGIKEFYQTMITTGYTGEVDENYDYKVVIGQYPDPGYTGSYNEFSGEQFLGGGISYFFLPRLKVSLSISSFETKAGSNFSTRFWEERYYPEVSDWKTVTWQIDDAVKIRPLLLTALYDLPLFGEDSPVSLYGGGGIGFYFTTLQSRINGSYGEPEPRTTTYNYQLTNNFQANTNPIGLHGLAGISFGWNLVSLHVDVSYHYAKGNIDQWNNSTRMQYYVYGMAKQLMDMMNVEEIDLGGLMVRGGVNVNF